MTHLNADRVRRGNLSFFSADGAVMARHFDAISDYAARRVALQVTKRHNRSREYGWSVLAFQSPDRLGLVDLNGTVVAPRPHRSWRGR